MGIIITIAWRNIWRHKGKSLIVGSILFLGALIMTVGTGVVTGMNQGLHTHIVDGFTGDIVLVADSQKSDNVFLNMMGGAVEPLAAYTDIENALAQSPLAASWMPIGKNMVMVLNEAGGSMDGAFVLGVDMQRYHEFFPDNLALLQGRMLEPGQRGVLLATGSQEMFITSMGIFFMPESTAVDTALMPEEAKEMGNDLVIKRDMVFMGFGDDNTTHDVRLPIRGLVKYKSLNTIWGAFILMDIESFRQCMGYVSASHQQVTIPRRSKELLNSEGEDIESLFSDEALVVDKDHVPATAIYDTTTAAVSAAADTSGSDARQADALDMDAGTYNLVLVRLEDGVTPEKGCAHLDSLMRAHNAGVRPVVWHEAIGTIGSLAMLIKASLFVFVMLIFFVAIVIIINTLTMTALERTPEIGMMRAIGAKKSVISGMFIAETGLLSSFFGAMGIAAGWIMVTVLSALSITTSNDMVQLIYGGDTFNPFLRPADFALVLIQLTLVVIFAVIYPVFVARNITPLDAVSRE
jgi:putative ABC transport system permease protein